jgi:hypothetical protein
MFSPLDEIDLCVRSGILGEEDYKSRPQSYAFSLAVASLSRIAGFFSPIVDEIRWDEKAGLRTGCGVRSQVIDVPEAQIKGDRQ